MAIYEYWCSACGVIQEIIFRVNEKPAKHPCPDCNTAMKRKFSSTTFFLPERTRFQRKVRSNRAALRAKGEWGPSLENPDHDDAIDPHA